MLAFRTLSMKIFDGVVSAQATDDVCTCVYTTEYSRFDMYEEIPDTSPSPTAARSLNFVQNLPAIAFNTPADLPILVAALGNKENLEPHRLAASSQNLHGYTAATTLRF